MATKREWQLTHKGTGCRLVKVGKPYARPPESPEYAVTMRLALDREPDRLLVVKYTPDEAERAAEQLLKYARTARTLNTDDRPRSS